MNPQAPSCRTQRASCNQPRCPRRRLGAAAALLVTLCLALNVAAGPQKPEQHPGQKHSGGSQMPGQGRSGSGISPQQAVFIAKQRQQGQVLSVKRTNGTYQVKMLHQGQVRYVNVAAD